MTEILTRQSLAGGIAERDRLLQRWLAAVRSNYAAADEHAIVPIAAGALAFLLAASLLGPFNPALTQLMLIAALATLAWPAWRASAGRPGLRMLIGAVPLLPVVLAPLCGDDGQSARIAGTAVALAITAHATRGKSGGAAMDRTAFMVAAALLIYLGQRHSITVWHALDALADAISINASMVSGEETRLGPVAAGLWPGLLGIAIAVPALRSHPRAALAHALLVASAVIAYAAFQMPLERLLATALQMLLNPAPGYLNDLDQPNRIVPGGLTGLSSLAVLVAILISVRLTGVVARTADRPTSALRWPTALALLIVACGTALAAARPVPAHVPGRVVAFYDGGDLDLTKPQAGRYGLIQSGMYGAMWDLLERAGYRCIRIDRDQLARDGALVDVSTLVIIMPRTVFAAAANDAVWRFVDRGGGLLVLGDHTDLFGVMEPLNRLLDPVGIGFSFDSAFPVRRHWQYALDLHPHALTAGLPDQLEIQIGTGSSLRLTGTRSSPLIVGRYAFGDFGNRLNIDRGGLLGDYRYQAGERLSDVPLVATAAHGAGRVVVFGDTSTFQVLAIPASATFVERIIRWLGVPPQERPSPGWSVGGVLLALAGLALLLVHRPAGVLALVAAAAGLGALGHDLLPRAPLAPTRPAESIAVVDAAMVPRPSYEFFADDSYGGVFTALFRAGYLPLSNVLEGHGLVDRSGFAAFIAPTRMPDASDIRAIEALLARGGTVLVADGRPNAAAANRLLDVCGLRIGTTPLGPAHVGWESETIDFVDAWPVIAAPGREVQVDAQWKDYALIAETRVGPGRCIALGDARFLADQSFEGEFQFHPVNVRFFDHLLESRPAP
jgi:hypothetical protein